MAAYDEYTIKYHHGAPLLSERQSEAVATVSVDPDKVCYWDLLGDVKELGFDIKKDLNMCYKDDEGAIKKISVDADIRGICEQLTTHGTVDIFVESSDVRHDQKLPEVLLGDNDNDVNKDNDTDSSCEGNTDDEELLAEAPFMTHNSDVDEEVEEAREKIKRHVQLKKKIEGRDSEHRMCARHVYARWGKKHPGKELQIQFWNVARSTNTSEMQSHLNNMKALQGGQSAVEDLLENWPIEGWCAACFNNVVKCEVIDNNMCETFNGVLLEARHKPVISMLEDIRQYVTSRIAIKRQYVLKWKGDYGPNIAEKVEKERKKSGKWLVEWNGGVRHEVYYDNLVIHVREGHVVMLGNQSCSCGKWDKSGIPCQHAIAAIAFEGGNLYAYVADWFKKETYLKAYQFPVNPLRGRKFSRVSEEGPIKSPTVKRMPGRPAVKRRREPLEGKSRGQSKLSREGRVMRCRICRVQGHNRLRCPQRYNTDTHGKPQAEPSQPGNVASSRVKKKRDNTHGIASINTASHQVDAPPPTSHTAASSIATSHQVDATPSTNAGKKGGKKKRKTNAAGTSNCPVILRGPHTGEAIVGMKVSAPPFLTTRELEDIFNKRREARMKAQLMTQQSRVDAATETSSGQFKAM